MATDTINPAPIAALRGGPGMPSSAVLAAFALRRKADGVAVAGVIEAPGPQAGGHEGCDCRGALLDLATGEVIGIHQDLGPGSQSCTLNTSALALACAAAERAIAAAPELVVLSRFGGQEAVRGGLTAAFQAAVAAGLPVACVVSPKAEEVWNGFAEGLAVWLPAEDGALEAWWAAQVSARGRHAA